MKKWLMTLCLAVLMLLTTGSETVLANDNTENTKLENLVETEENASRVKATGSNEYVSNINVNTTYTGQLLDRDEVEIYNFSLSSAGMVNVTFQHANLYDAKRYWMVRIYNDNAEYLMQMDVVGTDTNITSTDVGLPAGNYYVQIISDYKAGSWQHSTETYTFKVNYTKSSVWETEKNDVFKNADVITVNTSYSGANLFRDDVDCYKFSLNYAGKISVNFQHANTSDTDRYWVIRVYNENTEYLVQLDSAGTDTNKTSAEVGLPAGNYYVQIISDSEAGSRRHSTETYTFKVNYTQSSVWETENNNSFANADIISINKEYNGANQFYDDLDYYKFTVKKAGNFAINFQHANLKDAQRYWVAHLYDDTTRELIALDIPGSGKSVNSGSVYLQKGTYYLRINSSDYDGWPNNYSTDSYKFKIAYAFTTQKPSVKTSSVDYNKIKLSWSKIGDVDGYVVYRSTSKNGTYKAINTIKSRNNCTYTDKNVETGKTYYYKVRGYKKISKTTYYSTYSSVLKVKAEPAKASIKSVKAGTRRAIITWKKQSGVSGYEVYMSTKKSSGYKKITTVTKASKVKYSKSKLKEGKTYYFKVRAYKVVNGKKVYGKYSSVKSVRIVWK